MGRFEVQLQPGEAWVSGGLRYADGYIGAMDSNDLDTLYVQRRAAEERLRGEQPNNPALPDDGAMSGDISRSWAVKEIK